MVETKRLISIICLFLISVSLAAAQSDFLLSSSFDIITDYQFLQSLYPRPEGSTKEKQTISFIEERVKRLGLKFQRLEFSQAKLGHSFSSMLEISIPGKISDTLIIVLPLNHTVQAGPENSGSLALAVGLALLQEYRATPPPLSLKIVFLGAEYQPTEPTFLGSATYLDYLNNPFPQAVLYLALYGKSASYAIRSGGKGVVSPLWIVEKSLAALQKNSLAYYFNTSRQQVNRTALVSAQTAVETYLLADLPAIEIEANGPFSPVDALELNRLKDFCKSFINSLSNGIPPSWDKHYIFFPLPFFSLLLPETTYLVFLCFLFLLLFSLATFKGKALRKYLKTLQRNFWNIPVFFILSFLLLLASTLLLELLLELKNMPLVWQEYPLVFLLLKFSIFMFAAILVYRIGIRLPFAKNGSFYSAAALVFILICIFTMALINISFVYYFIWSLLGLVLFSLARSKWLKIVFFLLAPLSILTVILELFLIPELKICEIILFNHWIGNLLFAVIILPFVLLLIRLRLLFPFIRRKFFHSKSFILGLSFGVVILGTIIFIIFHNPYANPNHPKPILAEVNVDCDNNTSWLFLSAPASLNQLVIEDETGKHFFNMQSRSHRYSLRDKIEPLHYSFKSQGFAHNQNVDLKLKFNIPLFLLRLSLRATDDFIVTDSNFPLQAKGLKEYSIMVGPNPPQELLIQFTVPAGQTYRLELEIVSLTQPPGLTVAADPTSLVSYRLNFRKTISLEL